MTHLKSQDFLTLTKLKIQSYYSINGSDPLKGVFLEKAIERPFSHIGFWNIANGQEHMKIVSKRIIHHEINDKISKTSNQAVAEFDILKNVYPLFKNIEFCAVPKPLLIIPEIETYVMTYVPGDLLVDRLKHCRFFSRRSKIHELTHIFYNCGKWLQNFQRFTGIRQENSPQYLTAIIDRAEHRISLICKKNDQRIPKGFGSYVMSRLNYHIGSLKNSKILVSGRHSDFVPLNIIVSGPTVTVIDFFGYDIAPIPVDIFKMLIVLADEMTSVTSDPRIVQKVKNAFLKGYGRLPEQPYSLLYLCEAMQRIVSLWGGLSVNHKLIHHKIQANRRIRTHVNWLMRNDYNQLLWPSST